mmetsp:Transcript_20583/g.45030  ORF Transcript_20583/g.45030 Transcript_20583/m.45030 type:complete len:1098 (+) Transcript_20583:46-3339(+)
MEQTSSKRSGSESNSGSDFEMLVGGTLRTPSSGSDGQSAGTRPPDEVSEPSEATVGSLCLDTESPPLLEEEDDVYRTSEWESAAVQVGDIFASEVQFMRETYAIEAERLMDFQRQLAERHEMVLEQAQALHHELQAELYPKQLQDMARALMRSEETIRHLTAQLEQERAHSQLLAQQRDELQQHGWDWVASLRRYAAEHEHSQAELEHLKALYQLGIDQTQQQQQQLQQQLQLQQHHQNRPQSHGLEQFQEPALHDGSASASDSPSCSHEVLPAEQLLKLHGASGSAQAAASPEALQRDGRGTLPLTGPAERGFHGAACERPQGPHHLPDSLSTYDPWATGPAEGSPCPIHSEGAQDLHHQVKDEVQSTVCVVPAEDDLHRIHSETTQDVHQEVSDDMPRENLPSILEQIMEPMPQPRGAFPSKCAGPAACPREPHLECKSKGAVTWAEHEPCSSFLERPLDFHQPRSDELSAQQPPLAFEQAQQAILQEHSGFDELAWMRELQALNKIPPQKGALSLENHQENVLQEEKEADELSRIPGAVWMRKNKIPSQQGASSLDQRQGQGLIVHEQSEGGECLTILHGQIESDWPARSDRQIEEQCPKPEIVSATQQGGLLRYSQARRLQSWSKRTTLAAVEAELHDMAAVWPQDMCARGKHETQKQQPAITLEQVQEQIPEEQSASEMPPVPLELVQQFRHEHEQRAMKLPRIPGELFMDHMVEEQNAMELQPITTEEIRAQGLPEHRAPELLPVSPAQVEQSLLELSLEQISIEGPPVSFEPVEEPVILEVSVKDLLPVTQKHSLELVLPEQGMWESTPISLHQAQRQTPAEQSGMELHPSLEHIHEQALPFDADVADLLPMTSTTPQIQEHIPPEHSVIEWLTRASQRLPPPFQDEANSAEEQDESSDSVAQEEREGSLSAAMPAEEDEAQSTMSEDDVTPQHKASANALQAEQLSLELAACVVKQAVVVRKLVQAITSAFYEGYMGENWSEYLDSLEDYGCLGKVIGEEVARDLAEAARDAFNPGRLRGFGVQRSAQVRLQRHFPRELAAGLAECMHHEVRVLFRWPGSSATSELAWERISAWTAGKQQSNFRPPMTG